MSEPTLFTLDKKLDLLIQKVDGLVSCMDDHEKRLRILEVTTIRIQNTMTVLFGGTGLIAMIALLRSFFTSP